MNWKLSIHPAAAKEIRKLNKQAQRQILDFLGTRVHNCPNPRDHGKALSGEMAGFWRYRSGDYRIIVKIEDDRVRVLALAIGHRKEIYKSKPKTIKTRREHER